MAVIQDVAHRTDDSQLTDWYFGIDRRLLLYVGIMIFVGMIATFSAGSANFIRVKGLLPWYYFFVKMLPSYIIGIGMLLAVSMLNKKWILKLSWINVLICLVLLMMTCIPPLALVINGSARWVSIAGFHVMPSDIMKPGFVVITAWFLSHLKEKYGDNIFQSSDAWRFVWSSWWSYLLVFCMVLAILCKQPDFGTTILYFSVFGIMLFVAGLPKKMVFLMFCFFIAGGIGAFFFLPHVHDRILTFFQPLDPKSQVGFAVNAIRQGGLFGMGDEAFAAENLPMAENDFVYATLVEDFGALAGCLLLVLFVMVIKRLMKTATDARDKFVLYVITGTIALFSVQICLNLATTLNIMPPTGMTLPFISYGSSSFLGFCLLFGITLALIREDKWK